MHLVAVHNDGTSPNWEMFIGQGRWWKVIWEGCALPDGTVVKRTRSVDCGKATPHTPEHFYRFERFDSIR